jgi:hypothetical protein
MPQLHQLSKPDLELPTSWQRKTDTPGANVGQAVHHYARNNRLVAWAEPAGVRVPAPNWFRSAPATLPPTMRLCCSTLWTSISAGASGFIYCCFVNLAKAYDSVPRDLLWQRLHEVGVRGRTVTCHQRPV